MRSPLFPYSGRCNTEPRPGAPALETHNLSAGYPGATNPGIHAINLHVPVGARVAFVGPNGAGKSTLIKTIAGLLPIEAGEIRIYGNPVGACHHRVGYLPQRDEIDWRFPISVRRLVLTGRYVHKGWLLRPDRHDRAIADEMMERLKISDLADRQIGQLSGGQQQRALLARALAQDADLLLLDEPLNAVDVATRAIISEVLGQLKERRKTVIVATHDLGRLETEYDSAVYLCEGREIAAPPGAFAGHHIEEMAWTG
jgi:manganese/zinc/iron transport system ATP- binding protein